MLCGFPSYNNGGYLPNLMHKGFAFKMETSDE